MLNINENININANIVPTGMNKPVIGLSGILNTNTLGFGMSFNIMDKENFDLNLTEIQEQFNQFLDAIRAKMTELGYKITI